MKAEKININKFKSEIRKSIKWDKKHPVLAWLRIHFYRLPDLPRNIKRSIVSAIQRIKRGWSDRDTWELDYYLAKIIENSVYHLKKNVHGRPCDLTEGQWIDILNQIAETFWMARKIADGDLHLVEDSKKRQEFQITLDKINKNSRLNERCLTDKEIQRYKKGWKLFQKYFFNLWD